MRGKGGGEGGKWPWGVCCTYNLREIQRVIADSVEYKILQFVDNRQQVVAEGSHGSGCAICDWPNGRSMAGTRVAPRLVSREGGGGVLAQS
jgi:hypothetical protein